MSMPQWKGLFDWSMKYYDGTKPSDWEGHVDADKMKWLDGVLKQYMVDFGKRMQEIKQVLDQQSAANGTQSLEEKELLLEELMDIVSSIDYARDLHKIGGLATLLELLESPQTSLQWRAAEVVATCVQNNPPVQQWFLEGGVLPKLLLLLESQDSTCRVKALLALSSLVRHSPLAMHALRRADGIRKLVAATRDVDQKARRKAMSLLTYTFQQHRPDCSTAVQHGVLQSLLASLSLEDPDLQEAALGALHELAHNPATWQAVKDLEGLPQTIQQLQQSFQQLSDEDKEAQSELVELSRSLQCMIMLDQPPEDPAFASHMPSAEHGTGAMLDSDKQQGMILLPNDRM